MSEIVSSQRTLAAAIGVSAGKMNALIRELQDAGQVTVLTDSRGTRVRLVSLAVA